MFSPHLAQVRVEREEPREIDLEKAALEVKKRNAKLAEKIVVEGWLKRPKPKKSGVKKLRRQIEFEERVKQHEHFMVLWNKWRDFYFDLPPMKIKSAGQLTAIENIKKMAEQEGIPLTMLLGCAHKAYVWKKRNPNFTNVVFDGLDMYERFYEAVSQDIDRQAYMEDSLE